MGAAEAMAALSCFDRWLPYLSTVKWVRIETPMPLLTVGTRYLVKTPEGPVVRARIVEVVRNRRVRISTRSWLVRSELECEVLQDSDSVELVRRQSYSGLIGALWTVVAVRRERRETGEYLDVWSRWAQGRVAGAA